MDCVVTGGNVKVLAKAIHSLSRIGDELYLEPQENGLALRSVNSSRSAYACFLFSPLFFSRYTIPLGHAFRCKMAIKCVQAVFRSLSSLEKTVEKCHIELDGEKSRLTFTLHCKYGLLKTHNLSFQDSESLQAVFDKESCANMLHAQPRLLVDTVLHFPPSLEEVSVSVSGERVWFRNHVDDEAEQSKAMLTELCLSSDEFDHFAVGAQTSITFCLKELRGLLVFAESTGLPVSMYFDEPGSPVVLSVTDSVLEVNFVLATLSNDANLCNHNNNNTKRARSPPPDDFMTDDIDSYLIAMETSELAGPSDALAPRSPSSNHTLTTQPSVAMRRLERGEEEEEEDTEDTERPPNKKFRSLFFGSVCPSDSQLTNQTIKSQEVLASDSEDDTQASLP
ncbi:cell cycle checkpoint control protein RAD9A [Salmo salar]|uniref:Cell cycle checkpoint control protein n=1 Tax=Salmo salar TaxID=8030 RepID=A0A1S3RRV8_SALSA|nr:cell cycle checkpoint control protein RAD9A [Salmo salar]XP_014055035.1 cell cycle checkpoint control protein RAD9A [Salmo salar]XP_014055036.1 cell cycle checkpoint control protein RAD9A [Salmo salar]|eukprot:XP_014055034.1 PREDICTED: cell cycle checkpoint control protein RAD9A [Salmo salar]